MDEIAVSATLRFDRTANEIVDGDGQRYEIGDFQTKLLVYRRRVEEWFLGHAERLAKEPHTDYAVLQIAMSQIEGIEEYRRGKDSSGKSKEFFRLGMRRIFDLTTADVPDDKLNTFYTEVRCGLFHDGFTKRGAVLVSRSYIKAIEFSDGFIKIHAPEFLKKVKAGFEAFLSDLSDENKAPEREKFLKVWDQHWNAGVEPTPAKPLPISPQSPSGSLPS